MRQLIKEILRDYYSNIIEDRENWTIEKLKNLTSQYNNLPNFLEAEKKAASALRRKGLYDEYTSHMERPPRFWTKEKVLNLAKNFTKMVDFKKAYPKAYGAMRHNGWKEDVKNLMVPAYEYWDEEKIRNIASKYDNLNKFSKEQTKALDAARYRGIYDDITKHMDRDFHYWTIDEVYEIAAKYTNRKDFIQKDNKAYQAAVNNGWYDELSKRWDYLGNLYKRMVYVYEFPDKTAYVGLTLSKEKRHLAHNSSGPVFDYSKKTGLKPTLISITNEYIPAENAQELEKCTVEKYKLEGWNVLNSAKAGGLGSCKRIWTYDVVMDIALRYTNTNQFKKENNGAFQAAQRNGWINQIKTFMVPIYKDRSNQDVMSLLTKYNTLSDFRKSDEAGFSFAVKKIGYPKIKEYYDSL